jgi:hypothetical protein
MCTTTDKTVKAAQDRKHYLKTRERRLAYQRAYSREYKRKMREALGIKLRPQRRGTTEAEWRMLKSSQEAARYAQAMAFDPAGTLPLLREFMTKPIVHPPRPQEPAYAQVVSRSSNSRMEAQAQRAGQRQATCA